MFWTRAHPGVSRPRDNFACRPSVLATSALGALTSISHFISATESGMVDQRASFPDLLVWTVLMVSSWPHFLEKTLYREIRRSTIERELINQSRTSAGDFGRAISPTICVLNTYEHISHVRKYSSWHSRKCEV